MVIISLYETIKEELDEKIGNDRIVKQLVERLDNDVGTYEDAQKLAGRIGELTGGTLNERILFNNDESIEAIVRTINDGTYRVDAACEKAQQALNREAGIGMNPVKPSDAERNERTSAILQKLKKAKPEAVPTFMGLDVETLYRAVVDTWVQINAEFQQASGLRTFVVRKWSGRWPPHDTKHHDWCQRLAGRYEYDTMPRTVLARHPGCKCTISYEVKKK